MIIFTEDWYKHVADMTGEDEARAYILTNRGESSRSVADDMGHIARSIAARAHRDQVDKSGMPYITHPARIAANVTRDGGTQEAIAVAWLHDVIEDTDLSVDEIMAGFDPESFDEDSITRIRLGVIAITALPNERRTEYYARVMTSAEATHAKEWDVHDNTDPDRSGGLDENTRARHAIKYPEARRIMGFEDRWETKNYLKEV